MLKKWFLNLGAIAVVATSTLTVGASFHKQEELTLSENITTEKPLETKQTNVPSNASYQILETATYEQTYIDQLNADISNVEEEWITLDDYKWTEDLYPEPTLSSSYPESFGKGDIRETSVTGKTQASSSTLIGDDHGSNVYLDVEVKLYQGSNYLDSCSWTQHFDDSDMKNGKYKELTFYVYENIDPAQDIKVYIYLYDYSNVYNQVTFINLSNELSPYNNDDDFYLETVKLSIWMRAPDDSGYDDTHAEIKLTSAYSQYWYFTKTEHLEVEGKSVYIGDDYLNGYTFTEDDIANLIVFEGINMSYVDFRYLELDKTNRTITGQYRITYNSSYPWTSFSIPVYSGTKEHPVQVQAKPVYMDVYSLENHAFSETELTSLLVFRDTDMRDVDFRNVNLDQENLVITGEYAISNLDPNQINIQYQSFTVPVRTVDLNYLFTVSPESAAQWNHQGDGSIMYWQTPPETIVTYNNDWIYSAYAYGKQTETLAQFGADVTSWGFRSVADQETARGKIESYAINYWNYNTIKTQYQSSSDPDFLSDLEPEPFLIDYVYLKDINLADYWYVLANSCMYFFADTNWTNENWEYVHYGPFPLTNFRDVSVTLTQTQIDAGYDGQTTWILAINTLEVLSNEDASNLYLYEKSFLHFMDLTDKNYEMLFDVKVYVSSYEEVVSSKYYEGVFFHEYFFQAEGFDLGQDISFVLSDGTVLDQNFVVIQESVSSSLQLGDNGFVNARYWAHLESGEELYVTLVYEDNNWYAPAFEQNIEKLDPGFDEAKLEYVFNQTMNMIINPYDTTLGAGITATSEVQYGIETVTDVVGNTEITLETWDSGSLSHTTTIDGKALFDAVFGADVNGYFDPVGFLNSGEHKIHVDLKVARSDFNDTFNIVIDLDPIQPEITSNGNLRKLSVTDEAGQVQTLWYSNEPINILVNETDIANVDLWILHSDGSWYEVPVPIYSVQKDNQWVQEVDCTIDYTGLTRVEVTDQAGNVKTTYFLTNQNANELPVVLFNENFVYQESTYGGEDLTIYAQTSTLVVVSPVVSGVTVTEIGFNETGVLVETERNDLVSNYVLEPDANYSYGTTITMEGTRLPYAADELTPFLPNLEKVTSESWTTCNTQITLPETGLYQMEITTRIVESPTVVTYFYVNQNQEVVVINPVDFQEEESYFGMLPNTPQNPGDPENDTLVGLDESQNLLPCLNWTFFDFEITSIEIRYSLLWYSEFNDLNYEGWEELKEGKYFVTVTDVFGNAYNYQFLLLDKTKDTVAREQESLMQIYTEDQNEATAFWKGDFIWNLWRYEDQDHAVWEYERFVSDWIAAGNDPALADWAYAMAKYDPTWDGSYDSGPPSGDESWSDFLSDEDWTAQVLDAQAELASATGVSYDQITSASTADFTYQGTDTGATGGDEIFTAEYEAFVSDWVAAGNDPELATWAYETAKQNPTWDGTYDGGPPAGYDSWTDFTAEYEAFVSDWTAAGNDPELATWAYETAKQDPTWDGTYDGGPPAGYDSWTDFTAEYEAFVSDWTAAGNDPELATWAYETAKQDPTWDGTYDGGPPSGYDSWTDFAANNNKSSAGLWTAVGIIALLVISGLVVLFFVWRRYKTRRIK